MKLISALLSIIFVLVLSHIAFASDDNVSVTVSGVSFGSYNFLDNSPLDATGTIDITFHDDGNDYDEHGNPHHDDDPTGNPHDCEPTGDPHDECYDPTRLIIRLNSGLHSSGGFYPRRMRSNTGQYSLDYNLYIDSAASQVWGDGSNNTFVQAGQTHLTVYGRLQPHQNAGVGFYSDIVTVTVEW